jgi:hypothetical protein
MATILTKKKDTTGAPGAGDLTNAAGGAELAVNTADKRLYTKDSGGNVVEIGTNPSTFTVTSPKVITGINDTNNNEVFKITATGSAVNEFTVANAATGAGPTLSATGGDTNIDINITPKGTGSTVVTKLSASAAALTDPVITGAILEDVYTISDGAAFEIDPGNGSIQLITLGASRTPKATNFAAGESVTLMVDDGTAYTLTWTDSTFGGSGVVWKTNGGVAPTLNTSGYTVITLWKVSTQVYGARVGDA